MRVLCVGNMYPPHHLGGYELVWQGAVRELRRRGHEVRVLTTDYRKPGGSAGPEDPDVYRELRWYWRDHSLPPLNIRARLTLERHNANALGRHLGDLRPDVVSWWAMGGMSLSMIERVRRAGLPAVGFVHDDWMLYGPHEDQWLRLLWRRPWMRWSGFRLSSVTRWVDLAGAGTWVFVSEATRRRALGGGWALSQTAVAHTGIDPAFIDPAPAGEWGWRLLYFGRIDERKGIDTAVDALALLPDQAVLTVIGDGDERYAAALGERAARRGLGGRVRFEAARRRRDLPAAIKGSDAVVFPVRWEEPWGLVPLEAMACGRPVIATGRGGSSEYLRDGKNCVLFEAGDALGLADAIRRLAGDESLRARLFAGGVETARRYTEPAFNAAVAAELERAAERAGRGHQRRAGPAPSS
jgi:glycosyltransferase involved in cell wall biosynthesis